jgi:hypothetical protein
MNMNMHIAEREGIIITVDEKVHAPTMSDSVLGLGPSLLLGGLFKKNTTDPSAEAMLKKRIEEKRREACQ